MFATTSPYPELDTFLDELNLQRAALGLPTTIHQPISLQSIQEHHDRLIAQEEEYNRLSDRISSLTRGPLPDPLDALPQEIWERIICEAGTVEYELSSKRALPVIAIEDILPLTLVSIKWRDAILGYPCFWSTLRLQPGVNDLEAQLYSSIVLSKDFPLTVIVVEDINSTSLWEIFGHYIISQGPRIRTLILFDKPDMVFGSIREAPLLKNLHIEEPGEISTAVLDFIQSARSIDSITGYIRLPETVLQSSSMERIRTLDIVGTIDDLWTFILQADYLKSIKLTASAHPLKDPPPKLLYIPGGALLSWKRFQFNGYIDRSISCILKETASTLVVLEVIITWEDVPELLILCKEMPLLRSLDIVIPRLIKEAGKAVQFRPLNLLPSSIFDLHLEIRIPVNHSQEEANVAVLFTNLRLMTPAVQRLRVHCPTAGCTPLLEYLCSLNSLKSVEITFHDLFGPESPLYRHVDFIGTLSTEKLVISEDIVLDRVRTTGLMSFEYRSDMWPDGAKRLLSDEWRHLRVLSIPCSTSNWTGVSLPYVTRINFIGSDFSKNYPSHTVYGLGAFCQEMAICPNAFPSLEYIISIAVLEWDLLFLMLEQRNISLPLGVQKNISRIKRLELGVVPPLKLLKPLTALLGGQFTIRPSYRNLSLVGIANTLFNSSV